MSSLENEKNVSTGIFNEMSSKINIIFLDIWTATLLLCCKHLLVSRPVMCRRVRMILGETPEKQI